MTATSPTSAHEHSASAAAIAVRDDSGEQLMQCMEVWGGSSITDANVTLPGLDAWVYSKPYEQADAGGDVYYVSACATGRIVRLLVADVSGHGVKVRDTATMLRDLMRRCVNHIDQSSFVKSMNREFTKMSAAGCFATSIVTTFFAPTNALSLCNAGHPAPLLYRAKTREWSLLERRREEERELDGSVSNIPLGIEGLTEYEQFDVELDVGDLVLCYSDSLIESRRATDSDDFLGESGLLNAIQNCAAVDPLQPGGCVAALLAHIRSLNARNLIDDDVTILLFRPNGS